MAELISFKFKDDQQPIGIPLIPMETICLLCGSQLQLRSDRSSKITLYTDSFGSVPGTVYHKYCKSYRKGCKFVQYYGYHKKGGNGLMFYNTNWKSLPYFMSSQETGFELSMLTKFDAELLIGQISFKQKAEIYNVSMDYDSVKKRCSSKESEKTQTKRSSAIDRWQNLVKYFHVEHALPMQFCRSFDARHAMDSRRFESAFLRYGLLQMVVIYPLNGISLGILSDVSETLAQLTPALFEAFQQNYSGKFYFVNVSFIFALKFHSAQVQVSRL